METKVGLLVTVVGVLMAAGFLMTNPFAYDENRGVDLYPAVVQQATDEIEHIDIRVACESALAYMTFATGEAAEAFVEACVEGKHPEVLDRYIETMQSEEM